MTHRTIIWAAAALLGIAATATIAWSASQIAGQRIGLTSEPLSAAVSGLAPANLPADHAGRTDEAGRRAHAGVKPAGVKPNRVTPAATKKHAPVVLPTTTAPSFAGAGSPAQQPTTATPTRAPQTVSSSSSPPAPPPSPPASASSGSSSAQSSGAHDDNHGGGGGGSQRDD